MDPRRRKPLRRYPTAVCIGVWHVKLTQPTQPKDKSVEQPWPSRWGKMATSPLPSMARGGHL